jgi:hypothetical protein
MRLRVIFAFVLLCAGGGFFQVIPDNAGGLLLVVGEVAGKGLPAAMLVSVLVDAIRAAARAASRPSLSRKGVIPRPAQHPDPRSRVRVSFRSPRSIQTFALA